VSQTSTESTRPERFDIAVESEAPCVRHVVITVEPSHVAATRRKEGKKLGKSVRIKGFRKGKVPPRVIEERYAPVIDERTVTTLVNEGFREAVRAYELHTVGDPAVEDVRYRAGESLSFSVDVEVMPEITLERIGGFRVTRPPVSVDDSDIDELLERMRGDHAVLEPVERTPVTGDIVSVRIRPVDDEAGLEEEDKPYRFELGAGYAIPDVERAIFDLAPGESRTSEVTYPSDFGNEKLAGVTRSLRIELIDVKTKRLPELDDDFARELGDFDTLDELRTAIEEDLRKHREGEADGAVHEQLLDAVLEANAFEVPPGLVSRYLDQVLEVPDGAEPERLQETRDSVRPAVERQIKRDLVIDRLIEEHGAEPSREDVKERLREIGEQNGLSISEVRQRLAKEKRLTTLKREMAVGKIFELHEDASEID